MVATIYTNNVAVQFAQPQELMAGSRHIAAQGFSENSQRIFIGEFGIPHFVPSFDVAML